MKKSILLTVALAMTAMAMPQVWGAKTYAASTGKPCSHGAGIVDPCVESYAWNPSSNPCEKVYSPRLAPDPNVPSTTTGPMYADNSNEWRSRKLMRGIANVTLAVGEIPAGAFHEAYATSPVTGAVVGGANGVVTAVKRVGVGLFEIVTFPFAINMKPTGERLHSADPSHAHEVPDPGQWEKWGWGTLEGVDSCCNKTRGTFAPYIEPEIVYMDALPPHQGVASADCQH